MLSQQRLCKNLQRSCWESTSKMEPLEGGLPAKRCLVSTCSMLVSEVRLRYSGLGMSSMSENRALERIYVTPVHHVRHYIHHFHSILPSPPCTWSANSRNE